MAKNTTAYFLNTQTWVFSNGLTATTPQTLLTGVTDDTWVYDIVITSTATNALDAKVYLEDSVGNQIRLKTMTSTLGNQILIGQGTTTANPLRLMQSSDGNQITVRLLDRDQNYYIPIPNGVKLMFQLGTAPTGVGGSVNIAVFKRDFTA
jgi:hypothetical protein